MATFCQKLHGQDTRNEINHLEEGIKQTERKSESERRNAKYTSQRNDEIIESKNNESKLKKQNREEKLQLKKYLQDKGELCDQNCVLCCLLSICQRELNLYPCGRHLEKIIVSHVIKTSTIDDNIEDLCCDKFMEILRKSGIVSLLKEFDYRVDENQRLQIINQAWEYILSIKTSNVILGRIYSYENKREGHCVICNNSVNGIIYDSQKELETIITNVDEFVEYVSRDEGLEVYKVEVEKLKEILKPVENNLHCQRKPLVRSKL